MHRKTTNPATYNREKHRDLKLIDLPYEQVTKYKTNKLADQPKHGEA